MSNSQWPTLTTKYLTVQVLGAMIHLTPLVYLVLWRKHAYIQRLHVKLMIIRGQFMALFCTFLIHEFPVWKGGLDSRINGCRPLWITGHFAFSAGLLAETFSLLHMWYMRLVYTIDYLQSSTANVLSCEYQGVTSINLTKTVSGHRDRLTASHTFSSNPAAVTPATSRSFELDTVSALSARFALWIFHTPGIELVQHLGGDNHRWVLRSTRPDGQLPVVTTALKFRIRAKLLGVFAWLFVLASSVVTRSVMLPTSSLLPSFTEPCTADGMVGLAYLTTITTGVSLLIVAATQALRARCTEEMQFLRWTCGWRVVLFAFLAPCYLATWLNAPAFQGISIMFGPWVFPAMWETCSGALRSWSPVLIVWLQRRRDQSHWANLPETRLRKVLEDPTESSVFGEFCIRQHCSEAYQFYVDYQHLIATPAATSMGDDVAISFHSRKVSLMSPLMGSLLSPYGSRRRSSGPTPGERSGSMASEASSAKHLVAVSTNAGRPPGDLPPSKEIDESTSSSPFQSHDERTRIRSFTSERCGQVAHVISIEPGSAPSTPQSPHRGIEMAAIAPFLDEGNDQNNGNIPPSASYNRHDPFGESPLPISVECARPLPSDPLPVRLGYFSSQYVEQGAPHEVNISAASRQRFAQALLETRYSPEATNSLAEISEHVFRVMLDGVFVGYCENKERQSARKPAGISWMQWRKRAN